MNISSGDSVVKAGLFGICGASGVIQNLGIESGAVTGSATSESDLAYVGSICADNNGTIKNCYNKASISASSPNYSMAALIGYNKGEILNCFSTTVGSTMGTSSVFVK